VKTDSLCVVKCLISDHVSQCTFLADVCRSQR